MDLDHERRLTEVEQRNKSNSHRLDKLEESTEALGRLAASMEVMAANQKHMAASVDRLEGKVTILEGKPTKRWEALVDKVLLVLAGAFVAWLVSGAPGI